TLFTNGAADLAASDRDRLERAGVRVEERTVAELRGPGDSLQAVALADGTERSCQGLLVVAPMHQRSALASQLGARIADAASPIEAVEVDGMFRTTVAGLYAAGDISATPPPSVATAIAAGSTAAKAIVHDLVEELYPDPVGDPLRRQPPA
ncbi:MAG: NAD(P)/FAD-dependent oxidoreductase, partial [Actinobacteria bacterium]|nr:NAD(P)/FAD-dependent oxidoreductase [Actinomycetota bacterium]